MERSTKGQIQIGETVAVIFIFIILLVFGLVWFVGYSGDVEVDKQDELDRLQLLEIIKVAMNMPELQCSVAGKTDATCVDLERVIAFQEEADDPAAVRYRSQFFGYSLAITPFYPSDIPAPFQHNTAYEVFNYIPTDHTDSVSRPVPVILFDPVTERSYFSVLTITQGSKP